MGKKGNNSDKNGRFHKLEDHSPGSDLGHFWPCHVLEYWTQLPWEELEERHDGLFEIQWWKGPERLLSSWNHLRDSSSTLLPTSVKAAGVWIRVKHWGYLQVHVKIWFPKLRNTVNSELNYDSALKVPYKGAQCIKKAPTGFAPVSGLMEEMQRRFHHPLHW